MKTVISFYPRLDIYLLSLGTPIYDITLLRRREGGQRFYKGAGGHSMIFLSLLCCGLSHAVAKVLHS